MSQSIGYKGIGVALTLLSCWLISLLLLLQFHVEWTNPWVYFFILIQTHLYTGLFITAHDAMHRTVAPHHPKLNHWIGQLCTFCYAAMPFHLLNKKHHLHHQHVHTEQDPDYHHGSFWPWYFKFVKEYLTIWQLIIISIEFNLLKIWFPEKNLYLFWIMPSLLSTLQLFYFGTYRPHQGEHTNIYQSTSQSKNHLLAFLSCYFFGYHYEHHEAPATPWWRLWRTKD